MSFFIGALKKKIILDVGVNIDEATVMLIKYLKPDGTTGFWKANKESPTSISYITATVKDLNQVGTWKLQAYIEMPNWSNHGEITEIKIKNTL